MAVARSDEGSGNLTRRRTIRKPTDTPVPRPSTRQSDRLRRRRHRLDRVTPPAAGRSVSPADAEAVRPRRARRHRRAHRHEPRPAHRGRRSPADRTRRDRPRLRHARSAARRLRLPAQRRPQLPGLAGRHLRLSQPDSPARSAHRPGRRRADPPAHRGAGKLRPDAGRGGQRPSAGREIAADRLRGPDAAASQPAARPGNHRRRDAHARHRSGDADRHGPARPDRVAAARRQDRAAAKDRPGHQEEPSRMLPDRPADRRAAGRSDRHGPHRGRSRRRSGGQHVR